MAERIGFGRTEIEDRFDEVIPDSNRVSLGNELRLSFPRWSRGKLDCDWLDRDEWVFWCRHKQVVSQREI